MLGGEEPNEDGTRVGDERLEGGGKLSGSISRSGIGGDINGLRVIRKSVNLSTTLCKRWDVNISTTIYPSALT